MTENPNACDEDIAGAVRCRRDRHAAIALVADVPDLAALIVVIELEAREHFRSEQIGVRDGGVIGKVRRVTVFEQNGKRRIGVGVGAAPSSGGAALSCVAGAAAGFADGAVVVAASASIPASRMFGRYRVVKVVGG